MSQTDFTHQHLKDLAGVLLKTLPAELACDEWLDVIAPYAEAILRGGPLPANAALIQHHLDICPECQEEFDALLQALK